MHARQVEDRKLSCGNAGALDLDAMVMVDDETRSLWAQPTGAALSGELVGKQLKRVPCTITTLGQSIAEHPTSDVVAMRTDPTLRLHPASARRQELRRWDADATPPLVVVLEAGKRRRAYLLDRSHPPACRRSNAKSSSRSRRIACAAASPTSRSGSSASARFTTEAADHDLRRSFTRSQAVR